MKSSEALRLARIKIDHRTEEYVCLALEDIEGATDTAAYIDIQAITKGDPICQWLRKNSEQFREFDSYCDSFGVYANAMREYRLRWIDHLIPLYEAEGD